MQATVIGQHFLKKGFTEFISVAFQGFHICQFIKILQPTANWIRTINFTTYTNSDKMKIAKIGSAKRNNILHKTYSVEYSLQYTIRKL